MASLILALAVALLPADRHVRDVVPALPIVDARQLEEDALVDLDRLAKEFGAPKGFTFRRLLPVQVLAVLDVHVLRIASQRGVETVALHDLGGRDPRLPAEVDAWLCDVARPRVEAILREPGVLLFEVEGPRESVWDHPDREGRRLVEIVLHDEHGERSLGGILLAEGLAWLARDHRDLLGARGIVALLSAPSTPDSGLKLLPSLAAARDARACALAEVLLLDDARLTRRAQQIQAELASLLGWRPRELVEVRLLDDEAVALRLEEERERAAQAGEPVHDSATEMEFVARALRGPDVLVRRAALSDSVLDLALLDEVLAHEVAHQYQEEAGFWARRRTRASDRAAAGLGLAGSRAARSAGHDHRARRQSARGDAARPARRLVVAHEPHARRAARPVGLHAPAGGAGRRHRAPSRPLGATADEGAAFRPARPARRPRGSLVEPDPRRVSASAQPTLSRQMKTLETELGLPPRAIDRLRLELGLALRADRALTGPLAGLVQEIGRRRAGRASPAPATVARGAARRR